MSAAAKIKKATELKDFEVRILLIDVRIEPSPNIGGRGDLRGADGRECDLC